MKRIVPLVVLTALVVTAAPAPAAARVPPHPTVALERGVVAAPESLAAEVGAAVLRAGGNAVDAAVAVHFALAVTYPRAGNLGGGGFMLVHTAAGDVAIDYRETAPAAATRDMYLDRAGKVVPGLSLDTHLAAGVPGSVAGMWLAHRRFGSMPWRRLLGPAIRLAERGFPIQPRTAPEFVDERRNNFRDYFYGAAGEPLVQPELAATLRRIAARGPDGFYRGETARLIVEEMRRGGGRISLADLARYRAVARTPITGDVAGLRVVSMPPPSSGGVGLIELLNLLERFEPARLVHGSAAYLNLVAEIEKRVFADRSELLGDPDFVAVPVESLVSKRYAAARAAGISPRRRTPPDSIHPGIAYESEQTTHVSIVDRHGNAVANTTTLNDLYGSGVVVRGAGFLLNNEMDDFSARPGAPNLYGVTGGAANAIAPGKRMLSSMCPTFVFRGDSLWLVLGSPGGPTIFTTVFQVIVNRAVFGMALADAVATPRFHHQWPPREPLVDPIDVEPESGLDAGTRDALESLGYTIRARRSPLGDVQAIEVARGRALGVSDPRGIGHVAAE